ncbi:MAG: hypothetical protein Ta2A_05420 [Treponemataceae bacterium]|nr:MAG: hypothetical protein Ta2A_05420 [Treponemataceae bacterium]
MKKIGFISIMSVLLLASVAMVSCSKKPEAALESADNLRVSTILSEGIFGCTESKDGVMMNSKTSFKLGETVYVIYVKETYPAAEEGAEPVYTGEVVPEMKSALRASDKQARDFYHCQNDKGEQFWVQSYAIFPDSKPGVVVWENAMIYDRPTLAGVAKNGAVMRQYQVLGVRIDEATPEFACVSAYYADTNTILTEKYVKVDTLSLRESDIEQIALYNTAKSTKNDKVKAEILRNALEIGGAFDYLVEEELYGSDGDGSSGTAKTYDIYEPYDLDVAFLYDVEGKDEDINIRNNPGVNGTRVVTKAKSGQFVQVTGYTREEEVIGGRSATWCRIRTSTDTGYDGTEGWVFGAYLDWEK